MTLPEPAWLGHDMTPGERRIARARFLIKLAALYHSPGGQVQVLSEDIGLSPSTLSTFQQISPETAIRIEKALGRDLFPRELFRPDLFKVAG